MDEIILSWPNVSLTYMEHRNGMSCFAEFREIERSQYGYRLTVGQELHAIRYHGTNYDIFVSPVVVEIRQEGLVVAHLLQKEGHRITGYSGSTGAGGPRETGSARKTCTTS